MLLLNTEVVDFSGLKPLRFERMWVHMLYSFKIVQDSWNVPIHWPPTYVLAMSNEKTKDTLLKWNKEEVGNIFPKSELLQA